MKLYNNYNELYQEFYKSVIIDKKFEDIFNTKKCNDLKTIEIYNVLFHLIFYTIEELDTYNLSNEIILNIYNTKELDLSLLNNISEESKTKMIEKENIICKYKCIYNNSYQIYLISLCNIEKDNSINVYSYGFVYVDKKKNSYKNYLLEPIE